MSGSTRRVAWQYGLLPPVEWDEDCEREMRLQVDLWNALVEMAAEHQRRVRALLVEGDPALEALYNRFDDVLDLLSKRTRHPPRGVSKEERDEWYEEGKRLRALRHDLWLELKPQLAAARNDKRDGLRELADWRYGRITDLRHGSGLWWGNSNATIAAFDVATGRMAPGEQLRPQEWRGEGRLTNQIQKGIAAPALLKTGHTQVFFSEVPPDHPLRKHRAGRSGRLKPGDVPKGERLRFLHATVSSRGHGTRKLAVWPIIWHRDLPDGATIKMLTINRRLKGALLPLPPSRRGNPWDWHWTATFSCETPGIPASTSNQAAGIDIGWRKVENGVRVGWVAGTDGADHEIVLPKAWIERRQRLADVFAEARKLANDGMADTSEYYRLRQAFAHGIDEAALERREIYRVEAKALTERYGLIAVDKTGTARLARRKAADEGVDLPPETRRMRSYAAPGELLAEIERAGKSRGVRVLLAGGASTLICHVCGHKNEKPEDDRAELLIRQCAKCERHWDQDQNAAHNLLAAATAAGGPPSITLEERTNKGLRRARTTRKAAKPPTDDSPRPT